MLKEFWNEDTILASLILEKNKENSIPFCVTFVLYKVQKASDANHR